MEMQVQLPSGKITCSLIWRDQNVPEVIFLGGWSSAVGKIEGSESWESCVDLQLE